MAECHAGLEIAPYISSAMRRETLFSTSQKPRTQGEGVGCAGAGGWRERPAPPFPSTFWSKLNWMSTCTRATLHRRHRCRRNSSSLWAFFSPFCSCPFFSFLLSTSDKPLVPVRLAPRAPTVDFYTFRSRVSFSLGRIIRLKIGTLAEKRIEKSSLAHTKKKKRKKRKKKNIQQEKGIYFSISLPSYIYRYLQRSTILAPPSPPPPPPSPPSAKIPCSILLQYWIDAQSRNKVHFMPLHEWIKHNIFLPYRLRHD